MILSQAIDVMILLMDYCHGKEVKIFDQVWSLLNSLKNVKRLDIHGSLRPSMTSMAILSDIKLDLLPMAFY